MTSAATLGAYQTMLSCEWDIGNCLSAPQMECHTICPFGQQPPQQVHNAQKRSTKVDISVAVAGAAHCTWAMHMIKAVTSNIPFNDADKLESMQLVAVICCCNLILLSVSPL